MTYDIVEGTSNPLQFQLLEDGNPINLGGVTVTLLLEDRVGTAVTSPGAITVTDTSLGKVLLTPTDTTVFVASRGPYFARWKLTIDTIISFVPTSNRDVWNIVGQ